MRPRAATVYSERIERAIQKATYLHEGQVRIASEEGLPYASHVFSVFVIASKYTSDEDTLIAALLHDTVEDTDYTFKEMEREFGGRVADIVRGVTERKERDGKRLPWKERKLSYLDNLKSHSEASLVVCAADKIHNLDALRREYERRGEALWKVLPPGTQEKLWYYESVISILEDRMSNKEALRDLKLVFERAKAALLGEKGRSEDSGKMAERALPKGGIHRVLRWLAKPLKTLRFRGLSARIFGYGNRNTL